MRLIASIRVKALIVKLVKKIVKQSYNTVSLKIVNVTYSFKNAISLFTFCNLTSINLKGKS